MSISSCIDTGDFFSDREKGKIQKYYSAEEPGRWKDQAKDHDLTVAIIEDAKGRKGIEVSVPFTNQMNEQHYVEALVLLDHTGRQIDVKTFNRGEKATTIFLVTDKVKFPVYVMGRCNMHDWWKKKVEGTEKSYSKGDQ